MTGVAVTSATVNIDVVFFDVVSHRPAAGSGAVGNRGTEEYEGLAVQREGRLGLGLFGSGGCGGRCGSGGSCGGVVSGIAASNEGGRQRQNCHQQGKGLSNAMMTKEMDVYNEVNEGRSLYVHTQTWSFLAAALYEKFGFEPYMGPKPVGWSAEADFEADAVRGWQIVREMQAKMKK